MPANYRAATIDANGWLDPLDLPAETYDALNQTRCLPDRDPVDLVRKCVPLSIDRGEVVEHLVYCPAPLHALADAQSPPGEALDVVVLGDFWARAFSNLSFKSLI